MPDKQVTYVLNLRDKFTTRLGTANKSAQRFDKSMGSLIGRFATFAAVSGVVVGSVKKMADFEEAVSNLSAITGAVGDDLDFLSRKAIELGKATTKSSIDTVNAFKLIASAKPELLDNAQALAATTKEAITLSEASGLTLPDAARALASALNQFNLSADQSSRAINILAAGSKFAGAEIPDLTASLKEFGGIADSLDIPLEEAAAAVETVSSKELKGSRAGIQLKNVFLKLGSATDKNLNPKIVGLSKALENLAPIQDDVTELTKLFGRENILAGQTLIKQRNRLSELTEAMTGTNIAYEQAAINTDNLNSDVKKLSSAWEGFILNLNQGEGQISQVLRRTVIGATELVNIIDELNKTTQELGSTKAEAAFESLKSGIEDAATEAEKLEFISDRIREANGEIISSERQLRNVQNKRFSLTKRSSIALIEENIEKNKALLKLLEREQELILNPKARAKDVNPVIAALGGGDAVTKITAGAPKVFNINVENMIKEFTISTENITETAVAVQEKVTEALGLALADIQAVSQ
jgi:TP901 family phage tail tape measure protein